VPRRGIPLVVSAPSGTGKTTVCHRLVSADAGLELSVSHTTRSPRPGERDQNTFYVIFKTITSPVLKATRWITPRVILDRHLGLVAFFLLIVLWLGLTVMKIRFVLENTPPAS